MRKARRFCIVRFLGAACTPRIVRLEGEFTSNHKGIQISFSWQKNKTFQPSRCTGCSQVSVHCFIPPMQTNCSVLLKRPWASRARNKAPETGPNGFSRSSTRVTTEPVNLLPVSKQDLTKLPSRFLLCTFSLKASSFDHLVSSSRRSATERSPRNFNMLRHRVLSFHPRVGCWAVYFIFAERTVRAQLVSSPCVSTT